MDKRSRAAATTALLLTASIGGLAATSGAAQANHTHPADRAGSLTITIKSKAGAVKLSDDKFRPGNTTFRVKNMDAKASKGLVQIFRLKDGYTLNEAFADFGQLFTDPPTADSIAAVNRIDKNVVFYGGMEAKGKPSAVSKWAVNIDKAGTYYVANLDRNSITTFTVKGAHQKRALPHQDGFIDPTTGKNASGNTFKAGKHNAASGWMSTTNKAKEPHFVDVEQVKKGTKNSDITKLFNGTGPNVFVKHGGSADTGVISPGHRFLWAYHVPKGSYGVLCFWPSKEDGMPHAVMGMHIVTHLG
jgi:hypothetical protein